LKIHPFSPPVAELGQLPEAETMWEKRRKPKTPPLLRFLFLFPLSVSDPDTAKLEQLGDIFFNFFPNLPPPRPPD